MTVLTGPELAFLAEAVAAWADTRNKDDLGLSRVAVLLTDTTCACGDPSCNVAKTTADKVLRECKKKVSDRDRQSVVMRAKLYQMIDELPAEPTAEKDTNECQPSTEGASK